VVTPSRIHVWTYLLAVSGLSAVAPADENPVPQPLSTRPAASQPAAPTEQQIRREVVALSHPSRNRRMAAIRQLAGWGPLSFAELRRAAKEGSFEAALSARDLLSELESAILIGAQIRLEFSTARASWEEPVTLTVRMQNPSPAPIRVPWPGEDDRSSREVIGATARQVAGLLDVADFLVVTDAEGNVVELRIDPIEQDAAVLTAVQSRAGDDPPTQVVPAGRSSELVVPLFNRGWARYPLLAEGTYSVQFVYQPDWKDPQWTQDGFGLVQSRPVEIQITTSAPTSVRDGHGIATAIRASEDGRIQATLENQWDRPQWVSLNWGSNPKLYPTLIWRWIPLRDGEAEELEFPRDPPSARFDEKRVRHLQPGESVQIGEIAAQKLRERIALSTPQEAKAFVISASYQQLGWPDDWRAELRTRGKLTDTPPVFFIGTVESEPISIEESEENE